MTHQEIRKKLEDEDLEVSYDENFGTWEVTKIVQNPSPVDLSEFKFDIKILFPNALLMNSRIVENKGETIGRIVLTFRIWKVVGSTPSSVKEKQERIDAQFAALEQMVKNAKDDPKARSELVIKLFG